MSNTLIRQAFETRLKTWADANGLAVAWENVEFDPTTDQPFVQPMILPVSTKDLFLDQTGRDRRGIFQVNLSMPLGTGSKDVTALVDSLDAAFAGSFVQGAITVTRLSPMHPAPALPVANRYVVPVSAEYRVVTV